MIRFYHFNLIDQSDTDITPTVGHENAQFPVSNLKDDRTTQVFRSPDGVLTATMVFDFKTIEEVDTVLVVPDNVTKDFGFQTITIEANALDSWGSPAFSTVLTPNHAEGFGFKAFDQKAYRYWRITATNTDGFVELAKVFIGKAVSLEESNWGMGWTKQKIDRSKQKSNRYGQVFTDIINQQQIYKGSFELLDPTELELISDMYERNGKHTPVWVMMDQEGCVFDTIEQFSAYCRLGNDLNTTNNVYKRFDLPMVLIEMS